MKLVHAVDVPRLGVLRAYSHAAGPYLICAAVGVAFSAAALFELFAHDGGLLLWLPVAGGVFLAIMGLSMARSALRESNWLARLYPEGLYLQFRSYLNWHLPVGEPTIVYLPVGEIAAVGVTRTTYTLPGKNEATEAKVLTSVDIELRHTQTEPLRRALAGERAVTMAGRLRTKVHDYPVRMAAPHIVRVDWNVRTPPARAVEELGAVLPLRAPQSVAWPPWDALTKDQRNSLIRELCERGETAKAAGLAEMQFGLTAEEANELAERWMAE